MERHLRDAELNIEHSCTRSYTDNADKRRRGIWLLDLPFHTLSVKEDRIGVVFRLCPGSGLPLAFFGASSSLPEAAPNDSRRSPNKC
jgi:hypothetical protein